MSVYLKCWIVKKSAEFQGNRWFSMASAEFFLKESAEFKWTKLRTKKPQ